MKTLLLTTLLLLSIQPKDASAFHAKCEVKFERTALTYAFGCKDENGLRKTPAQCNHVQQGNYNPEAYVGLTSFGQIECETKSGLILRGNSDAFGPGLFIGRGNFDLSCPLHSEKALKRRLDHNKNVNILTADAQFSAGLIGVKAGIGFGRYGNPCFVGNVSLPKIDSDDGFFTGLGGEVGIHHIRFIP